MSNSALFEDAHRMAKAVHVKGECYQVTFGAALKYVRAIIKSVENGSYQENSLTMQTLHKHSNKQSFKVSGWVRNEGGKNAYVSEFSFIFEHFVRDCQYYIDNFDYCELRITIVDWNDNKKMYNLLW